VNRHAAIGQFDAKLIERQFASLCYPQAHKLGVRLQLAAADMTLPPRRKRARLGLQLDQIVHKARRNAEMPRCFPMPVAFFDKRNDTHSQLYRMRFAHIGLLRPI